MGILITGAAGFIGMQICARLLATGEHVTGIDNFDPYYDVALKRSRVDQLRDFEHFTFIAMDINETEALQEAIRTSDPDTVVHMAAQAGVRYSLDNPFSYERCNLRGQLSVLEACRHSGSTPHLIYASSSSVYGERPLAGEALSEDDPVDEPASLYAATKRSCELMSGVYTRLYGVSATGLRFFSVYGPWGRPDMAYFKFTRQILAGEPIDVFGNGRMARDFTYISDVVDAVIRVINHGSAPGRHSVFNVGKGEPVELTRMIDILEQQLGRTAIKRVQPMQLGDVTRTHADIKKLQLLAGYTPRISIEEGLQHFTEWYLSYKHPTKSPQSH